MTSVPLRAVLLSLLGLLAAVARADFGVGGQAVTTRFWDCCKPSCSWNNKGPLTKPVTACDKDDKPLYDISAGTGCNGGSAYQCTDQQPWAVNDTFSYGFAGIFLTGGHVEDFWCCACYQLDFTSDPLRNKTMIIQASNTAYDVNTANRFSLAVPGGNTTSHDACASQFGVDQSVFGQTNAGVGSEKDCDKLPEQLQAGCRWRYEWFLDASYPTANFKRVICPAELTKKTGCSRTDDTPANANKTSSAVLTASPASTSFVAVLSMVLASLLSVYR